MWFIPRKYITHSSQQAFKTSHEISWIIVSVLPHNFQWFVKTLRDITCTFLLGLLSFCHVPREQPAPGNPGLEETRSRRKLSPTVWAVPANPWIRKTNVYFESHQNSEIVTQHPWSMGRGWGEGVWTMWQLWAPSALNSTISLYFSSITYKKDFTTMCGSSLASGRPERLCKCWLTGNPQIFWSHSSIQKEYSHFNPCPRSFLRLISDSRSDLKIENPKILSQWEQEYPGLSCIWIV